MPKLVLEFLSNEKFGKCCLILENEKTVGYVILTFVFSFEYKRTIATKDELFIEEVSRRIGIGKITIQFIQKQTKDLLLKILCLEIENHNENAQNLYLSQNFEFYNQRMMKFKIK